MKQNVPCAARGLAVQLVCIGVEEVREAREGLALQTLLLGVRFSGTRRDGRTCQVLSVCPALLCSARCPRRLACVDCLTSLPLLQLPAGVGQWEVPTELGRETERVSPGYLFSRLPFCQAAPGWLCVHLANVTVLFTWG